MTARPKAKTKSAKENGVTDGEETLGITSKADLKTFLMNVRDKLSDGSSAPIHALSAFGHALNLPNILELLDPETKELARDVWLRLRQAGLQVRNPPALFAEDESTAPIA